MKGHRATRILQKAQNQLLSERVRQIHFTIDALTGKVDQTIEKLTSLLPNPVLEEVTKFVDKAQTSQHTKGKERQTRKFSALQARQTNTFRPEVLTWRNKENNTAHPDMQEKWVRNLSDRELSQPEKDVLAKGLNFAVTPE